MLFRLTADQRFDGIVRMLEIWSEEVDRFRAEAAAVRTGTAPAARMVAVAEEAHDGLVSLLDDIERAIEKVPPGDRRFTDLLNAQAKAVSMLESVTNSLDVLSLVAPTDRSPAVRIGRPLPQAAE